MSSAIILQITDAGVDAAFKAQANGFKIEISHIGYGDASYEVTGTETAMQGEFIRLPISTSYKIDGGHVVAVSYTSKEARNVAEIGAYLSDGTLFALFSWPNGPKFQISDAVASLLQITLRIHALPAESITISSSADFNILDALMRIAQLETIVEAQNGLFAQLLAGQARIVTRHIAYHHDDPLVSDDFVSTLNSSLN